MQASISSSASFTAARSALGPTGLGNGGAIVATMVRHEIRRLVTTFRFPAISIMLLALLVLPVLVEPARYRASRAAQTKVAEENAAALRDSRVDELTELPIPALRPSWRLSFAVDGGQSETPDVYYQALSPLIAPEVGWTGRANERLPNSAPLDWMFTIRVVLSLTVFLLAHDAVCGERQRGTLKILFSYPVRRWKILAAKVAALWICLAVPLLLGLAVSGGLLLATRGIPLEGEHLLKAGLVAGLGLLATAMFVLIALIVSSATRSPSTSLSVLALLWIGGAVVVPALGELLARRLEPIPTPGEVERRMQDVKQRVSREHAGREGRWRTLEWAAADGYAWEQASARAESERWKLQEEVRWWGIGRKLDQARTARNLAALSPLSLVQDLGERLTGSGDWRERAFLLQARAFRSILEDRIRRLDATDPESPHLLFFRGYVSRRPVPPGAVPRFIFREIPLAACLQAAGPALAALGLEILLLAAIVLLLFTHRAPG